VGYTQVNSDYLKWYAWLHKQTYNNISSVSNSRCKALEVFNNHSVSSKQAQGYINQEICVKLKEYKYSRTFPPTC